MKLRAFLQGHMTDSDYQAWRDDLIAVVVVGLFYAALWFALTDYIAWRQA